MNKKIIYTLCACFLITGSIQAKKTVESRSKLQESIGCQAGELLEHTHKVLPHCAQQLRAKSCDTKQIAALLEQLAVIQDSMFDLLKELADENSSHTLANATRKELELLRNTLQEINKNADQIADATWWQNTHTKITQVLPKTTKQTKE